MTGSVLFRCDAGAQHGLGHLSRCLTLANAFSKQGVRSLFVVNAPEHVSKRVSAEGHQIVRVGVPLGPKDDPRNWFMAGVKLIILDSKSINQSYVAACQALAPVGYFDDEIARDLMCDLIINNHPWASTNDYGQQTGRRLLLGPRFNTVRPEFFKPTSERHGLLITLGGEDPSNDTTWLIEELAEAIGHTPTMVVIGPAHPNIKAVQSVCKRLLPESEVYLAPPTLVPLTQRCRFAISAAGTTCYELAAAGVAMAVLAVEDHQVRLAEKISAMGVALKIKLHDDGNKDNVRSTYANLINPKTTAALAAASRQFLPRPGVDLIVGELFNFII